VSGATQTADGKRKYRGKAVINGEPVFTSVSSLEMASQCLRRWHYRFVIGGYKDEDTDAAKRGTDGHERIAHFLTTGDRSRLNALIMRGFHLLPPPGSDLYVEYDFAPYVEDHPDGCKGLSQALLRAGGIPLIGAIDLMHDRRENYGVEDISDAVDEPGVIKLCDHKFPKKMDYAKRGDELVTTFQMAGYGKWAFMRFPQLERVRLTHNYFPTKGSPRAPTALVTRDQVERTWMAADAVGVAMRDAAREPNPDKVDANTRHCHAFGKACPAIDVCKAAKFDSLEEWVGTTATQNYLDTLAREDDFGVAPSPAAPPRIHLPILNPRGEPAPMATVPNSLFQFVAQTAGVPSAAVPQAPGQAPGSYVTSVDSELARLQAGLGQAALQPQVVQAPPPVAPAPAPAPAPAVAPQMTPTDYVKAIYGCGLGFPRTSGSAAVFISSLTGRPVDADGTLPGEGQLAIYTIPHESMFPQVLDEVRGIIARTSAAPQPAVQVAPSPTAVTPPDAPVPNAANLAPMAAHVSAEDAAAKKAAEKEAAKLAKEQEKAAKKAAKEQEKAAEKAAKDAAKSQAAPTTVTPAPAPATEPAVAPATTVVNSVDVAPAPAPAATTVVNNVVVQSAPADNGITSDGTHTAINLFVDCIVDGKPTQSLLPLIHQTTAWMNKDSGCLDFREQLDGKYSHGKAKGVLAGCLRAAFKAGKIAPGNYAYQSGGDLSPVIVETMREIVALSGGTFVMGTR
jgi:hypothetical protein